MLSTLPLGVVLGSAGVPMRPAGYTGARLGRVLGHQQLRQGQLDSLTANDACRPSNISDYAAHATGARVELPGQDVPHEETV
jgi:hypothetical protein